MYPVSFLIPVVVVVGVIVGRALYLGRFTLKDALRVARDGIAR